jgi:hypothetical protein
MHVDFNTKEILTLHMTSPPTPVTATLRRKSEARRGKARTHSNSDGADDGQVDEEERGEEHEHHIEEEEHEKVVQEDDLRGRGVGPLRRHRGSPSGCVMCGRSTVPPRLDFATLGARTAVTRGARTREAAGVAAKH